MTIIRKVKSVHRIMGRLSHGVDLLEELTNICSQEGIQMGRLEALGAVQKACIGFYDQKERKYEFRTHDQPFEILKLSGNISLKNRKPMVHAHITLADSDGRAYGGHLASGSTVFACEYVIEVFEGPYLERQFDEETGLQLWAGGETPPANA